MGRAGQGRAGLGLQRTLASFRAARAGPGLAVTATARPKTIHDFGSFPTEHEAAAIFGRARGGHEATHEEHGRFASYMMLIFGRLDAEKGWTKQLHLGARRNNNTRRFREMGPDTGWDSIGDWPQGDALGA